MSKQSSGEGGRVCVCVRGQDSCERLLAVVAGHKLFLTGPVWCRITTVKVAALCHCDIARLYQTLNHRPEALQKDVTMKNPCAFKPRWQAEVCFPSALFSKPEYYTRKT